MESFREKWQAAQRQLEEEHRQIQERTQSARALLEGLEDELERIRLQIGGGSATPAGAPVSGNPSTVPGAPATPPRKTLQPLPDPEEPPPLSGRGGGGGFFRK